MELYYSKEQLDMKSTDNICIVFMNKGSMAYGRTLQLKIWRRILRDQFVRIVWASEAEISCSANSVGERYLT
jgi:hypothetical protein